MIKHYLLLIFVFACQMASAQVPNGYYGSIDGKKYTSLKSSLQGIIAKHTVLSYNSLWDYYPSTYYVTGKPEQVLDMYSAVVTLYSNHGSLNKEHTVPKSWWGGNSSCHCYSDLYNVIPSESKANSAKSNYPLGIIKGTPTFNNGITKVGPSGVSGYSGSVFEPCDKYKGDFARIYFYVATCYSEALWDNNGAKAMTNKSDLTLQSWIIPLLVKWNDDDPVDADEILRNNNIYDVQGNRNPFIDYPELVDYIWGDRQGESFYIADHKLSDGTESAVKKAAVPEFSCKYGESEDRAVEVAAGTEVVIQSGNASATLYTRVNGGEWTETLPAIGDVDGASYDIPAQKSYILDEDALIEAYCAMEGRENSDVVKAYFDVVDYSGDYLLYEDFESVTQGNSSQTSGSSAVWSGNATFPGVSKCYQAGKAVKLGSGSASGSIASCQMDYAGGAVKVEIDVKGWTAVEGDLVVSVTGAEEQRVSYTSTISDDYETVVLTFDEVSSNPVLTISTSSKRAFINCVKVQAAMPTSISVPQVKYDNTYYNINGQKLIGVPTRKGIYIYNGAKVLVR